VGDANAGRREKALSADPYEVLGVAKDASAQDIQKAYRALAKKLHPDLNPGNKACEEKFKALSAAYDLIGDPEKRARFDRGEIDASGAERPPRGFYRDHAGGSTDRYASTEGFADMAGADDILAEIFGRGDRGNLRMRGQDARYRLELDFLDAVNGGKRQVTLPDGSALDVTIPAGTRDGQVLRLRGKGMPGFNGGPPGDALVEIAVRPHSIFVRKGDDIHIELPIPLREAVLGGRVEVPTPQGPVSMTVPKWSNTGSVLRLRARGVPRGDGSRGDEYVTLKVTLPAKPDSELERLVAKWRPEHGDNPQPGMEA
jgi:DnaJ-class molecular chaperone